MKRCNQRTEEHAYVKEYYKGVNSTPGSPCPYGLENIGQRCAWLAGHFDKHGAIAWEQAKQ